MDSEDLLKNIVEFIKRNLLGFVLLCIGFVLVIIGIFSWFGSNLKNPENDVQINTAGVNKIQPSPIPTKLPDLTIDIEGAVVSPGVYTLPGDSRIRDALSAAGGLSRTADEDKVAKGLNLSAKLTESMKIYIPAIGDSQAVVLGSSTQVGDSSNPSGPVNINTASLSDLDNLPGVGPVTAQKIIDNRPYQDVSDLQTKKVVKSNVYSEIKDKVAVN